MRSESDEASTSRESGLGDIMGGGLLAIPNELRATMCRFTPLQRVALSANGNLQRLVSSYYNLPVTVTTIYNRRVAYGTYERKVKLSVKEITFAVATSSLLTTREDCIKAIETQGIAIGQMFRYFNILPQFKLLDAMQGEGTFSRRYQLCSEGVLADIEEALQANLFALFPAKQHGGFAHELNTLKLTPGLGDIMTTTVTAVEVPPGFTPMQRMLLTANGNVERIISAYYHCPVTSYVALNHRRESCVFDRQVSLLVRGQQFMLAKSTIFVTSPEWEAQIDQQDVPIGCMYRHMSVLPMFTLRCVGKGLSYFWRVYTLSAKGMTCEITETFSEDVFGMAAVESCKESIGDL